MAAGPGYDADKYDVYRPELWTPRITRFMKEKLYAAKFFKDYSADIVGADTLHVPHISDTFTATAIPTTSGSVTAEAISETKTDLTVDNWYGKGYYITKFEEREIMKRPNIINEYSQAIGYRLGRYAERAILDNITSITPTAGTTTTSLVATNLEAALGILESNSVPKENCRFFFEPKVYWSDIMSIQKYYDASQFGKATLPHGIHDYLYGVPVTLTPNVPHSLGVKNAVVHPDSIIFAMYGPDFTTKGSEHLRKKIIGDIMYGDAIMQPTWGVQLLATS